MDTFVPYGVFFLEIMRWLIVLSLGLLCILYSCNLTHDTINQGVVINLSEIREEVIPMSKIFSDVEYIILETKRESVFDYWADLYVTDEQILIVDERALLFDRHTGKFLKEISRKGRGPNEYMTTMRNSFDNSSKVIYFNQGNRFIGINIENDSVEYIQNPTSEQYKNTTFGAHVIMNLARLDDNHIFAFVNNISGNDTVKGIIFNSEGTILRSFPNYLSFEKTGTRLGMYPAMYYYYNDKLFFKEPFNDTVFYVDKDHLTPVFSFSLGHLSQTYEKQYEKQRKDFININRITETKGYIFFSYWINHVTYGGYYCKKTGKTFVCKNRNPSESGFVNDFDKVGSFRPLVGVSDDKVAGFIDAGVFCKSKKELIKSGKITADKLEELSPESNSIVAIAKLK